MSYLYFAYGSNCIDTEMQIRCKSAINLGLATLPDNMLKTYMHSTVVPSTGDKVDGVLWRISNDADLDSLDKYEGFPYYYTRQVLKTNRGDAIVYIMVQEHKTGYPAPSYSARVLQAYKEHNISAKQYTDSIVNSNE